MFLKKVIKRALPPWLVQYKGDKDDGVYLTFDDGPHPSHTKEILGTLDRYGITANFFILGACAERYPAELEGIAKAGHFIGCHLYSHRKISSMTPGEWQDEIERTEKIIWDIAGRRHIPIRPPYGDLSFRFLIWAAWNRKKIIMWSLDSEDSYILSADDLAEHLEKQTMLGGEIVLFHEDYPHTVQALPRFIDFVLRKGRTFSSWNG